MEGIMISHNRKHQECFTSSRHAAIRLSFLLLFVCSLLYPAVAHPNGGQNNGSFSKLSFTVATGGDDLRGGNDNLNVGIHFRDGNVQWKQNVNNGRSWENNSENTFHVDFSTPHDLSEVASIEFRTTFTGGSGGDNWDMAFVSVRAIGLRTDQVIVSHGFYRFTGDEKSLVIPITMPSAGKANKLELTIKTGADDLRGDNYNLDITIHYRDSRTQLAKNINGGRNWTNGSTHTETITLDRAVEPSEIVKIDLKTRVEVAYKADNWDMTSISVRAIGEGVSKTIASYGFNRFTEYESLLSIPVAMPAVGKVNKLEFIFQTGGDDLRSDSNVAATIRFRDGHKQDTHSINAGQGWANQSMHSKTIPLDDAVEPSDIVEIDLETWSESNDAFHTSDNWSMSSVTVKALGEGIDEVIFRHGFKRFTGDDKVLRLKREQ